MALAGGVTTAVTCPGDANLIGGTCAAIKTSGKTVSEMTMVPELAFHMCLTDDVRTTYSSKRAPKTRLASAALIREALMKAKITTRSGNCPKRIHPGNRRNST